MAKIIKCLPYILFGRDTITAYSDFFLLSERGDNNSYCDLHKYHLVSLNLNYF